MKKFIVIFTLIAIAFSCSPKKNHFINNPNGSSELATLMNQMYSDLYNVKAKIVKGKKVNFQADYSTIMTAVPTDASMKNNTFEPFATALLYNVKELNNSTNANQLEAYKTIVQTCISCHNNSCPGPLMRIANLEIKD